MWNTHKDLFGGIEITAAWANRLHPVALSRPALVREKTASIAAIPKVGAGKV